MPDYSGEARYMGMSISMIEFLKQSWHSLEESIHLRFDFRYPRRLRSDDLVTRVVKSQSQIKKKAKFSNAFMPKDGALSVFTIANLSEQHIWMRAEKIAQQSNKKCYGRGDLVVEEITSIDLAIGR